MSWISINLIGCIGFLCFILYDLNQVFFNKKFMRSFFLLGCFLVITASVLVSLLGENTFYVSKYVKGLYALFSALFFLLLIYTLFFAVPFKEAYVEGSKQKICTEGIYALSRHPGVLWFTGCYFWYSLFLGSFDMLHTTALFTILNIIYVILQDCFTFPKLFEGYDNYKKSTPFLMPNKESIRRCFAYFTEMGQ